MGRPAGKRFPLEALARATGCGHFDMMTRTWVPDWLRVGAPYGWSEPNIRKIRSVGLLAHRAEMCACAVGIPADDVWPDIYAELDANIDLADDDELDAEDEEVA